ncbi:hypothetical protein JHK87_049625 [Glycine soja]|nr:hypothetical protein JHK87_049625 [Glycine soja]
MMTSSLAVQHDNDDDDHYNASSLARVIFEETEQRKRSKRGENIVGVKKLGQETSIYRGLANGVGHVAAPGGLASGVGELLSTWLISPFPKQPKELVKVDPPVTDSVKDNNHSIQVTADQNGAEVTTPTNIILKSRITMEEDEIWTKAKSTVRDRGKLPDHSESSTEYTNIARKIARLRKKAPCEIDPKELQVVYAWVEPEVLVCRTLKIMLCDLTFFPQ